MSVIPHWNRLLVAAVVAVLSTAALSTAQADLVLSGSTFYSYDFEDVLGVADPASSTGDVTWGSIGTGSKTRVNAGPVLSGNRALRSGPVGTSNFTGKKAIFSTAMQNDVPTAGTIDFRLYLDDLGSSEPSVFRVMENAGGSVSNGNTLFGVLASSDPTKGLRFTATGTYFNMRPVVLDEWIDVSIDYSLDSSANNLKVTLNSNTIMNESFTYTKDLTGETTNGFLLFNNPDSGSGNDNVFHIDDINWQGAVAAVPEPSSFAFFSLLGLLATGSRRKKSA